MRISRTACVALIVLTMGCGRDNEHVAAPQPTVIAAAKTTQQEEPGPLEEGDLYVVPGKEWSVVMMREFGEDGAGYLYVWRHRRPSYKLTGHFRHVPLEGPPGLSGMSWSPNGQAFAFYEETGPDWDQYTLCHLRPAVGQPWQPEVRRLSNSAGCTAWSPNSRYLAFVYDEEDDSRVRCFPKTLAAESAFLEEPAEEIFDLPVLEHHTIRELHWAPDSSKLLGVAYVQTHDGDRPGDHWVTAPALFLTWPGADSAKVLWQDKSLKDYIPSPQWTPDGELIVFAVVECSMYDAAGPLYTIKPDGSELRALWKNPEVLGFELSPGGHHALLWLMEGPYDASPLATGMGAVNVVTGETKVYEKGMVSWAPEWLADEFPPGIVWAEDGSSVSLPVYSSWEAPLGSDWHRVTLQLP